MNKLNLLNKAKDLYLVENLNVDKIAEKLKISRRTVFNWIKKYKWNEGKFRITNFANQFSPELYSIGSKLLQKTNDDLDNNRNLNLHSIRAIEEIIKIIAKSEKYEFEKKKLQPKKTTQSSPPEYTKQIPHDFLGIDYL